MSLKNQRDTITNLEFYHAESFQLGLCPLVLAVRFNCGLCKKKTYPAILENKITGEIRKGFICFRCGETKLIDDLIRSSGDRIA